MGDLRQIVGGNTVSEVVLIGPDGKPDFGISKKSDPVTLSGADVTITTPIRGIYVGTGGTLVMQGKQDTAPRTWKNVPSGSYILFDAGLIRSAANGTTAADLIVNY